MRVLKAETLNYITDVLKEGNILTASKVDLSDDNFDMLSKFVGALKTSEGRRRASQMRDETE